MDYKSFTLVEKIILFLKYSKLATKLNLEYKFDGALVSVAVFFREMISVAVIYLLLTRFVRIKGWEMKELYFLYSFLFLTYSLFVFFFSGIRDFENMVYQGELDRYLVRPVGLMFQIVAGKIDYPAALGHGVVGTILLLSTVNSVGIHWNISSVTYYIFALIGGAVIQASIFLMASCFSFWTVRVTNLRNMMFFNARRFAGYPISFYPLIIQKLLIFVIPFAFVSYFPAQYFLRKPDMASFWEGYLYLTPVVAIVIFSAVYSFWNYGIRHYSSTGTAMY